MSEAKNVEAGIGNGERHVGETVAHLNEELSRAGCGVNFSGTSIDKGLVELDFDTTEDATRFMNIVAPYETAENSIYQHIENPPCEDDGCGWWIDLYHYDSNAIDDYDRTDWGHMNSPLRPSNFMMRVLVSFPVEDLPKVFDRLKLHILQWQVNGRAG